jgi:hypothetical protein
MELRLSLQHSVEERKILKRRGSQVIDNRLKDDGKVVSLTLRPLCSKEVSWHSFLLEDDSTPWP